MSPDDYYSQTGQYLGTDGSPTNDIQLIKKDDFNNISGSNGGDIKGGEATSELQGSSRVVTVTSPADQTTYMDNLYTTGNGAGNGTGHEINVPMVLDVTNATLGFGTPQTGSQDDAAGLDYVSTQSGNSYVSGHDPNSDNVQLIVGVAHDHPEPKEGETLVSGVTMTPNAHQGCDKCTAEHSKSVVYAIDKDHIHKVDQNGNATNNLPRNSEVLRDALETRGGKTPNSQ